jgi:hemerythrin-like domain-containing protein
MSRSKKSSGSQSLPVALELLATDHRKVEELFRRYEDEKDGDEEARRALAGRICNELKAHTQLEEEILYPWLRDNLDDEDAEMVEEALVEHASAKDLVAQLEGAAEVDETYDAKVKVLGEYVRHHVREEENEIFPKVSGEREELDEVGQEMHARKAELMEELGMADDAQGEAAGRMDEQSRSRRGDARAQAPRGSD